MIGIDVRTLIYPDSAERGIGQYTLHHLSHLIPMTPDWQYHLLLEPSSPETEAISQLLSFPNTQAGEFQLRDERSLDLFHIPDPMGILPGYDSPFRLFPEVASTAIFHDLTPLVLSKEYLDRFQVGIRVGYLARLKQLRQSNARVLSVSRNTARDLQELIQFPADRIEIVNAGLNTTPRADCPAPAEIEFTRKKYGIDSPFFLSVGGIEPHKQFNLTLGAFTTLRSKLRSQLVVVGSMSDPWKIQFKQYIEQQNIPGVVFTGFVSREELQHLYADTLALIFPSKYEGFGLPVLEAMANGCPVIACKASSIPEVAGDAALLFPPEKPHDIAGMMYTIANDGRLRNRMIAKGLEQAKRFTWEKVAQKTIRVFEKIFRETLRESGAAGWGVREGKSGDSERTGSRPEVHSPDQVAQDPFLNGAEISPENSATIQRIERYLAQGRIELALKIAQKELRDRPELPAILGKIKAGGPAAELISGI